VTELAPLILWSLLFLFFLRVAGQAFVSVRPVRWLPGFAVWYSGRVPYPILLPAQIALLVLMAAIALDVTRGAGLFAEARPDLSRGLLALTFVYSAAMLLRLGLRIRSTTAQRWYEGGTMPTVFHFVLAGFAYTYARSIAG